MAGRNVRSKENQSIDQSIEGRIYQWKARSIDLRNDRRKQSMKEGSIDQRKKGSIE